MTKNTGSAGPAVGEEAHGRTLLAAIANRDDVAVDSAAQLRDLMDAMYRNGKGVVVVLAEEKPVGILTERDLVRLLYDNVDLSRPASLYTTKALVTTSGSRSIQYGLNLLVANNIRRLIIVDDDGAFIGIVNQQDLMSHLEEDFYRSVLRARHIVQPGRDLVTAGAGESLRQVLKKMVSHRVSAVPVLEDGKAVGIITENDMLRLAHQSVAFTESVTDHMTAPVLSVDLETRLVDVVRILNDRKIKRVVVHCEEGRVLGMITNRDLVRSLEGDYNEFLERKLSYSKEILNLLPEMILEVIDTGGEQLVVWANHKARSRFGADIVDRPIAELIPQGVWEDVYATLVRQGRVEDVRFAGEDEVLEFSGFYMPLEKSEEKGRVQLVMRDITEDVALATTDPLTGAYNRRHMNEVLSREADRCQRNERRFAVAIADLDDFKTVNDTYGHHVGDEVLRFVAELFFGATRKYDVVGRYGGEEFLLVLPEVGADAAFMILDRVRGDLERLGVPLTSGKKLRVTMSIGAACWQDDGVSPEDLLLKADQRLYRAKQAGKNRVVHKG